MILNTEIKILERVFAVAFLMKADCDLAVGLGHPEPVAVFAKIGQRLFGVIAADRVFVQFAINACKGDIDYARKVRELVSRAFEAFP